MKTRCFGAIQTILAAFLSVIAGGDLLMPKKANAGQQSDVPRDRSMPPARDPQIAVAEEYEIARRRGTAEAFEMFIARHPDSALADQARSELKRMKR